MSIYDNYTDDELIHASVSSNNQLVRVLGKRVKDLLKDLNQAIKKHKTN